MLDGMLRFRCSGDGPKRDAASPPPGTGQTSPNPGIATYGLPRPTSQTTSSKPRNRYIRPPRPTPDLQTQESLQNPPPRPPQTSSKLRNRYIRPPRTTPDLLQTQDSQYSLDIHNTTQHDYPTRHSTTTRHPKRPSHDAKPKQYWDTSLG